MCTHEPQCPPVDRPGWEAARLLIRHDEWGWGLLCNGAIVLDEAVQPATSLDERRARQPVRTSLPLAA